MRLKPGGLRELHWHAIAAEWAYVVKGTVRTTVISPNGEAAQDDFGPGDVWFFPKGHGHALQGVGPGETNFVLGFDDGYFSEFGTFSITDWIGHTPSNVLSQNLGTPESTFTNFPKTEVYIMQGRVPAAEPELFRSTNLQGFGHFVEQLGEEPTKVLILFNSPVYEEINISSWLAANPAQMIADNFGITKEMIDKLPKKTVGFAARVTST
jgi:oxalate decarboxylase/phosphoglucose isomerase-like protein (cupin superfamily)